MKPCTDSYILRMKNLHQRYGLSEDIMQLFSALDNHHQGKGDTEALGRWMRMSPRMRQACTDTISSLTESMQNNPAPECVDECSWLIRSCTAMLKLVNEPKQNTIFPFMLLPPEIRQRVYSFYFSSHFRSDEPGPVVIIPNSRAGCACPSHESQRTGAAPRIWMPLCLAARCIRDEVFAAWYASQVFHFACCCELHTRLQRSASLRSNLRNLKVHWTGPESQKAFELLQQVSSLKSLTVVISRSTTQWLSEREASVIIYFRSKGPLRLCDALGYDELVGLRGLTEVHVEHVSLRQGRRCTYEERNALERALETQTKDRPEESSSGLGGQ